MVFWLLDGCALRTRPLVFSRAMYERWKMRDERWKRKHVIPPSVCEEWNLYTKILSLEIPTDTAEREQKPSLAWIMPSREEEKPTLCRINQHSPYARLWHDVGVTPVLLLDISIIFQLSSFLSHLSSFISHLSSWIPTWVYIQKTIATKCEAAARFMSRCHTKWWWRKAFIA